MDAHEKLIISDQLKLIKIKKQAIVYIHIGLEKTGTTSLQEFFYLNKKKLLDEYQIYYPESPGLKNHINFPLFAFYKNLEDLPKRQNLSNYVELERFKVEFKQSFISEVTPYIENGCNILISNEHLSSRASEKGEIKILIDLFSSIGLTSKVVVYLRRQDKFLVSTYSTWVKCGGTSELIYKAYKRKRYNYLYLLNMWSSIVGKENIIVEVFEKEQWKEPTLYANFAIKLGIKNTDNFILPQKMNASLDKKQLNLLLTYNRLVPNFLGNKKDILRNKLILFLEKRTTNVKLQLTAAQKEEIIQFYSKDNSVIVKKYMKNKDQPLFKME